MNRYLFDTNLLLLLLRLGMTSRNMGKNDLWIAATASVLQLKFFTTDSDFDHLAHDFIDLERIDLLAIGK